MIGKLDIDPIQSVTTNHCIINKINEIIDWIDDVSALRITNKQVTANLPNIDAGELAFLSKENTELKDELERTRKALEIAVDALGYYASENSWDETDRWMFVDKGFEGAKDALEQITALEQKDK